MQPEMQGHRHLHRHGFDPRAGSPPDWLSLILIADSEAEVVRVTRDYLAAWPPEEIVRLPDECHPGRVRDGVDISNLAFVLAREECFFRGDEEDLALLQKMTVFFTHAATRAAHLLAEPPSYSWD